MIGIIEKTLGVALLVSIAANAALHYRNGVLYDDRKAQELLTTECTLALEITEKNHAKEKQISQSFQNELANLNDDYTAIRLRLKNKPSCITVSDTTSRPLSCDTGVQPAERDGLRAEWLYDYAKQAERMRLQLIGIKEFHSNE